VTTTGEKQIKARNFKHEFGSKDIRFASQEEITAVSGAIIGSIPPF
jgi:prolyl-tRNA editing enzyme YbaK/EbsC (Cys-tRNA(Pro) deacylase)